MQRVIESNGLSHMAVVRARQHVREQRVRLAAAERRNSIFNTIFKLSLSCYCKLLMLRKTIGLLLLLPRGRCALARTRRGACA